MNGFVKVGSASRDLVARSGMRYLLIITSYCCQFTLICPELKNGQTIIFGVKVSQIQRRLVFVLHMYTSCSSILVYKLEF